MRPDLFSSPTPNPRRVVLLGHRASGKSTLGRIAAEYLGWDFVDLDQRIEERTGKSPEVLVAEDEEKFRRIESAQFSEVLDEESEQGRIISPGAGCRDLPSSALCVWLWRDGWEKTAKLARARLRPDWSFEREVEWMRSNREPRWQEAAHLFFAVPRGRTPRFAGEMLADYLRWADTARRSTLAARTWVVPDDITQFDRARRDAHGLGFAGVEVRSDLCREPPEADDDLMASLRTPDADWLEAMDEASAFDVDVSFLETLFETTILERCEPTTLLISTHPDGVDGSDVERLVAHAQRLVERAPAWADHLGLKYAPTPHSIEELGRAVRFAEDLHAGEYRVTFLPQGERFAWLRPLLGHRYNATNYLGAGLRASRLPRPGDRSRITSMDLQDWLPHFSKDPPPVVDGLLGDPVDTSMGDWWHTRQAQSAGNTTGYLKITAGRHLSDEELDRLLALLHRLEVRGLSVTSPLKRRIVEQVDNPEDLEALNTLRRTESGWTATDTDATGMLATLDTIEQMGVQPGTVALIGRGGVSPAIRRAIETSDWRLVQHVSARQGWGTERSEHVDLVINAGGHHAGAQVNAPTCEVWLDLHYHHVDPPPRGARIHLIGDTFFVAQAEAQREFWNLSS